MAKLLSIATVLAGLILAGTPWLLRFTGDRTAFADVVVGGLVVALLGIFTTADLAARGPGSRGRAGSTEPGALPR